MSAKEMNLAHLMKERMANTLALVVWIYLKYLRQKMQLCLERNQETEYTIVSILCAWLINQYYKKGTLPVVTQENMLSSEYNYSKRPPSLPGGSPRQKLVDSPILPLMSCLADPLVAIYLKQKPQHSITLV